jgi:transglutaminase-like putative cysteine protease
VNYKITHATDYQYSQPVRVSHNLVLLTPREDALVHCHSHRLVIHPVPQISAHRKDFFGNHVNTFSIEESHKELSITATSRVSVTPPHLPDPAATVPWEQVADGVARQEDPRWPEVVPLLYDSRRIRRSHELAEYAHGSFQKERPILEAALDLTARIHRDFRYAPKSTTVATTSQEAFRIRQGVCQDFAHVQVACLRSIGLPARYVSGYLRTIPPPGKPRLIGADQSHAWLSLYGGSLDWIDLDPTNSALCSTDHIAVAWGRDYSDIIPLRGVFLGGGQHQLSVSVDVWPLEDSESK